MSTAEHTKRVVVFGGYGVFGSHVCRELVRLGLSVVVAGRDAARAKVFAAEIGAEHLRADVNSTSDCHAALDGAFAGVNCAGPFNQLKDALLNACLERRCHYADIADDRAWIAKVRSRHGDFAPAGLCALYGCSSLPAISGALALHIMAASAQSPPPSRARVTLFIGNDNPKGAAAIRSFCAMLGTEIHAPQGVLHGFRNGASVELPPPFGVRRVYTFQSADYDLLPALISVPSVEVKVGFESRLGTRLFAVLAALGIRPGERLAPMLAWCGGLFPGGHSGGTVKVELFFPDGSSRSAALYGATDGQRMAALPCALAVHALLQTPKSGALAAYELLGAERLLKLIVEQGFILQAS